MSANRDDLRRAVGRALKRVREHWQLSLDDIEQASVDVGVRITRSHLSRVENGQADLALPRFLTLMRAVGQPPGAIADDLDALLEDGPEAVHELEARADSAFAAGDVAASAALLRRLARRVEGPLPAPLLERWAVSEAAIGRWRAAARALRVALGPLAHPPACAVLRLAASLLGAGQPGVAQPIARGTAHDAPDAAAVFAAACAADASGPIDIARLDEIAARGAGALPETAAIVRAELYRRRGQGRAALAAADRARSAATGPLRGTDARLTYARAAGDLRRPAAGLREIDRARPHARGAGLPDLLARCHAAAAPLLRLHGDPEGARQAQRAARAIARRHAADAGAPDALPLHSLFDAASSACPGATCPIHGGC